MSTTEVLKKVKGSMCSVEGTKYEHVIHDVLSKCLPFGSTMMFNTQHKSDLGGSNHGHDINCNWNYLLDTPIEIKKMNTPDWMQCSLTYDDVSERWIGSSKNKIPYNSKLIFEDLLSHNKLFQDKIPPFFFKNMTHDEWKHVKKEHPEFSDMYFDCPDNTIQRLYREKGCRYIQISEKGLYHLGDDTCGFDVPKFICQQEIRVRIKVHERCNSKGYCVLSVSAACKPKQIADLVQSPNSLDSHLRVPQKLKFFNII